MGGAAGSTVLSGAGSMLINSSSVPSGPLQQQEDISTIFVVGFPDDMQVCTFWLTWQSNPLNTTF